MGLNEEQFKNRNTNFNAKFEIVDGYQTIERKRLAVNTGSAEKAYDGTPLKNTEASLTGLVEGETATVTATGEQTNAGQSTESPMPATRERSMPLSRSSRMACSIAFHKLSGSISAQPSCKAKER